VAGRTGTGASIATAWPGPRWPTAGAGDSHAAGRPTADQSTAGPGASADAVDPVVLRTGALAAGLVTATAGLAVALVGAPSVRACGEATGVDVRGCGDPVGAWLDVGAVSVTAAAGVPWTLCTLCVSCVPCALGRAAALGRTAALGRAAALGRTGAVDRPVTLRRSAAGAASDGSPCSALAAGGAGAGDRRTTGASTGVVRPANPPDQRVARRSVSGSRPSPRRGSSRHVGR